MAHDALYLLQLDTAANDEAVLHCDSELPPYEDGLASRRAAQGVICVDDGAIHTVLLRYNSIGYIGRDGAVNIYKNMSPRPDRADVILIGVPDILLCSAYFTSVSNLLIAHYRGVKPRMFYRGLQSGESTDLVGI